MEVGQSDPVLMQTPRLLERGRSLTEQDGMAREAKTTLCPAVGGAHSDALRGSTMTIAADQNVGGGPGVPEICQKADQEHGICGPRRAGAGTEKGRDQGLRRPCANAERQRAMLPRVMSIERALLLTIRRIIRGVQSQDNSGGGLNVAGDKVVDQGACEALESSAVDVVFEPREGRSAGAVVGRVQGTPLHPECAHGIMAEVIGVIRICIS
jgi:hypothetical protein